MPQSEPGRRGPRASIPAGSGERCCRQRGGRYEFSSTCAAVTSGCFGKANQVSISSTSWFGGGTNRPRNATNRGNERPQKTSHGALCLRRIGLGRGGERRAAAAPNSKWGRHCCRPHSHRRVDVLTLRDLRRTFDPASVSAYFRARCLASRCPVLRPALPEICHRCSRRHPALAPARFCVHRLTEVRAFSPSCTFAPAEAAFLYLCCTAAAGGFRRFRCVPHSQVLGLSDVTVLPCSSQRTDLPSAEAFSTPPLDEPVTMCHRHPWDRKLGNFKALQPFFPVAPCPEDRSKMRLNRRSDNIPRAEFSTHASLACGHEWITQRLIAFAAGGAEQRDRSRLCDAIHEPRAAVSSAATRFSLARKSPIRRRGCGARAGANAGR